MIMLQRVEVFSPENSFKGSKQKFRHLRASKFLKPTNLTFNVAQSYDEYIFSNIGPNGYVNVHSFHTIAKGK